MASRTLSRMATIASLLVLAGCSAYGPSRPLATEAETLAVHGEPTRRHDNGDGTTTLEYSTQPFGYSALMVTVDRSGVVVDQRDALSDKYLADVRPGMTMAEVSRMLGRHRSVQTFRLSGEEVWDWNVHNDGPGVATLFNVHFIGGKVVRTSRTYVFPNDGPLTRPFFSAPLYAFPYPYALPMWYRWRWRYHPEHSEL